MTDLFKIVQLFRNSKQATFAGAYITGSVSYSDTIDTILKEIVTGDFSAGRINELELDNVNIDHPEEFPECWSNYIYTFEINQSDSNKFN